MRSKVLKVLAKRKTACVYLACVHRGAVVWCARVCAKQQKSDSTAADARPAKRPCVADGGRLQVTKQKRRKGSAQETVQKGPPLSTVVGGACGQEGVPQSPLLPAPKDSGDRAHEAFWCDHRKPAHGAPVDAQSTLPRKGFFVRTSLTMRPVSTPVAPPVRPLAAPHPQVTPGRPSAGPTASLPPPQGGGRPAALAGAPVRPPTSAAPAPPRAIWTQQQQQPPQHYVLRPGATVGRPVPGTAQPLAARAPAQGPVRHAMAPVATLPIGPVPTRAGPPSRAPLPLGTQPGSVFVTPPLTVQSPHQRRPPVVAPTQVPTSPHPPLAPTQPPRPVAQLPVEQQSLHHSSTGPPTVGRQPLPDAGSAPRVAYIQSQTPPKTEEPRRPPTAPETKPKDVVDAIETRDADDLLIDDFTVIETSPLPDQHRPCENTDLSAQTSPSVPVDTGAPTGTVKAPDQAVAPTTEYVSKTLDTTPSAPDMRQPTVLDHGAWPSPDRLKEAHQGKDVVLDDARAKEHDDEPHVLVPCTPPPTAQDADGNSGCLPSESPVECAPATVGLTPMENPTRYSLPETMVSLDADNVSCKSAIDDPAPEPLVDTRDDQIESIEGYGEISYGPLSPNAVATRTAIEALKTSEARDRGETAPGTGIDRESGPCGTETDAQMDIQVDQPACETDDPLDARDPDTRTESEMTHGDSNDDNNDLDSLNREKETRPHDATAYTPSEEDDAHQKSLPWPLKRKQQLEKSPTPTRKDAETEAKKAKCGGNAAAVAPVLYRGKCAGHRHAYGSAKRVVSSCGRLVDLPMRRDVTLSGPWTVPTGNDAGMDDGRTVVQFWVGRPVARIVAAGVSGCEFCLAIDGVPIEPYSVDGVLDMGDVCDVDTYYASLGGPHARPDDSDAPSPTSGLLFSSIASTLSSAMGLTQRQCTALCAVRRARIHGHYITTGVLDLSSIAASKQTHGVTTSLVFRSRLGRAQLDRLTVTFQAYDVWREIRGINGKIESGQWVYGSASAVSLLRA